MTPQRIFCFRNNILFFAGILAVQGAWLMTAEFIRPKLPYFIQDKASEQKALAARSAAVAAASIGWVRGDLWTDAAIALSSGLTDEAVGESDPQMTVLKARRGSLHNAPLDYRRTMLGRGFCSRRWILDLTGQAKSPIG